MVILVFVTIAATLRCVWRIGHASAYGGTVWRGRIGTWVTWSGGARPVVHAHPMGRVIAAMRETDYEAWGTFGIVASRVLTISIVVSSLAVAPGGIFDDR